MNVRNILIGVILMGLGASATASDGMIEATRAQSAEQAVELATDEILELIEAGREYAQEDPERFYVEVEAMLRPLIDFRKFADNVMGKHRRNASEAQRARFADSFKWSLVRTYALALTEFGGGRVEVLAPRRPPRNPDKAMVTMEIAYEGKTYVVAYRMERAEEAWKLRNLIIEGVNIGLNYKNQFDAAMKDGQYGGDLDKVIDAWSDFIDEEEAAAEEEAVAEADV